jgi:hypothetical protein
LKEWECHRTILLYFYISIIIKSAIYTHTHGGGDVTLLCSLLLFNYKYLHASKLVIV